MKKYFLISAVALTLFSCNDAYRAIRGARTGTSILAGKTTSYTGDYTFINDSIVVEEPFTEIEKYMTNKNWTVSRESDTFLHFEYGTTAISKQTTGRLASGQANFSKNSAKEELELTLRLRGNYQFGTKDKALKYYNELREILYGLEPEKSKKKK